MSSISSISGYNSNYTTPQVAEAETEGKSLFEKGMEEGTLSPLTMEKFNELVASGECWFALEANGQVYHVNYCGQGSAKITMDIIEALQEKYDFSNMSCMDYYELICELGSMDLISGKEAISLANRFRFAATNNESALAFGNISSLSDFLDFCNTQYDTYSGLTQSGSSAYTLESNLETALDISSMMQFYGKLSGILEWLLG